MFYWIFDHKCSLGEHMMLLSKTFNKIEPFKFLNGNKNTTDTAVFSKK